MLGIEVYNTHKTHETSRPSDVLWAELDVKDIIDELSKKFEVSHFTDLSFFELQERFLEGTGSMPDGGEARMQMTLGYDPEKSVFRGTWVGSMMTHMFVYEGTLDADQKVLTLETEGPSFKDDGKTARYRDVITLVSANERTLTSFGLQPDGSWSQMMQATYRRK